MNPERESLLYATFRSVRVGDTVYLLVNDFACPEPEDVVDQNTGGTVASPKYRDRAVSVCEIDESDIILLRRLRYSADQAYVHDWDIDGEIQHIPDYLGWFGFIRYPAIAFDANLESFQSVAWLVHGGSQIEIDEIQALGQDGKILKSRSTPGVLGSTDADGVGVNHNAPTHHVVLAGSAVIGYQIAAALGTKGWGGIASLTIIDNRTLRPEDLPAAPHADIDDVGVPWSVLAARHLGDKITDASVDALVCRVDDPRCDELLAKATVILGCGADDGTRVVLNQWAAWYLVPYIDIAFRSGPRPEQQPAAEPIGRIRVIQPGVTGCLVCSDAYDPIQAALDLMTDADRELYDSVGIEDRNPTDESTCTSTGLIGLATKYGLEALHSMIAPRAALSWDQVCFGKDAASSRYAVSHRDHECRLCRRGHSELGKGMPYGHAERGHETPEPARQAQGMTPQVIRQEPNSTARLTEFFHSHCDSVDNTQAANHSSACLPLDQPLKPKHRHPFEEQEPSKDD